MSVLKRDILDWDKSRFYEKDDLVVHEDDVYKSLVSDNFIGPWNLSEFWELKEFTDGGYE